MKFSVLALDFDGTIAEHDRLDPAVATAITDLRARGVVVVLATGRIIDDLARVAGDLRFVDAVVAENGAVVLFPATGVSSINGHPPPPTLQERLDADGIPYASGHVVVETDAKYGVRLVDIIRHLELPLTLAFNRSRVMLLPQSVSKATGVRQALTMTRLSPRNAVAIGDAENDHELLGLCELGVAVSWGSAALKAAADVVLPGNGPADVAPYLRHLAATRRIAVPVHTRRQLTVGTMAGGERLALAVRGRNVLVAGDPKSGKSWVTGLLAEQLILHGYSLCILDPEGDYRSLEALPGVVVLGGGDPLPSPLTLIRTVRHPDVSVVVDLSRHSHAEKFDYVRAVLPVLAAHRRHTGLPHRIVLDEAHYFLHDSDAPALIDLELNGYTIVSYRASRLHPNVLAASETILVTRESDPVEVRALAALCRSCGESRSDDDWRRLLGDLAVGEVVLLPVATEAHGLPRRLTLAQRMTPHVRHVSKYVDIPVSDAKAFVFWRDGVLTGRRARTLREFADVVEAAEPGQLEGHVRRNDFSRWIAQVFGDHTLAATIRQIEDTWPSAGSEGAQAAIAAAVRDRYELTDPAWAAASSAMTSASVVSPKSAYH